MHQEPIGVNHLDRHGRPDRIASPAPVKSRPFHYQKGTQTLARLTGYIALAGGNGGLPAAAITNIKMHRTFAGNSDSLANETPRALQPASRPLADPRHSSVIAAHFFLGVLQLGFAALFFQALPRARKACMDYPAHIPRLKLAATVSKPLFIASSKAHLGYGRQSYGLVQSVCRDHRRRCDERSTGQNPDARPSDRANRRARRMFNLMDSRHAACQATSRTGRATYRKAPLTA